MIFSKKHRYQGALVAVLYGDAAGAPYESWFREKILADLGVRGGLQPFDYRSPWPHEDDGTLRPAGLPTDDADQSTLLAQWLIAYRGKNPADLYQRLRWCVMGRKSPLQSRVLASGTGRNTKLMLESFPTYAESQRRPVNSGEFPSNGCLMRSAPLGLFFGSLAAIDPAVVRAACEVTHWHPLAYECTLAYVALLASLLEGHCPSEALRLSGKRYVQNPELRVVWESPTRTPEDPGRWPCRGAALFTLQVAVWALMTTSSFEEGIRKAIEVGGDTDTYAAVAGGLLGARYGVQGVPKIWSDTLLGGDVMFGLADQLYNIATA